MDANGDPPMDADEELRPQIYGYGEGPTAIQVGSALAAVHELSVSVEICLNLRATPLRREEEQAYSYVYPNRAPLKN